MKEQPIKTPLLTLKLHETPPPQHAELLIKVELIMIPLLPSQKIPPPYLLAVLLINIQSDKLPSVPFQKTAPPLPVWKLKFQKEKI